MHPAATTRQELPGGGNRSGAGSVHVGVLCRPFRGSTAVAAGVVTAAALRGPRFQRLYRDVYLLAGVEVDAAVLAAAAFVAVDGRGVLGGWSAASCSARPADPSTRPRRSSCRPGGGPSRGCACGTGRWRRPRRVHGVGRSCAGRTGWPRGSGGR